MDTSYGPTAIEIGLENMMALQSELYEMLQDALGTEQPALSLRESIKSMLAEGTDRDVLSNELRDLSLKLREQDREPEEDVILDVLDFLTGWTSDHLKI